MENGKKADSAAPRPDSSRWCWECRRRRLVCDCTRPVCDKCKATGVVCPGYEDRKPLTWLAPGKVLSRTRKPRGSRPAGVKKAKDSSSPSSSSSPDSNLSTNSTSSSREEAALQKVHRLPPPRTQLRTDMCDLAEAAMYCKTGPLQLPLLSLWAHFGGRHEEAFFRRSRLTTRLLPTDNSAVYPDLVANQLAPNRFVVPVLELHGLPSPMQHALVTIALSHRIYRSAPGLRTAGAEVYLEPAHKEWWARLHHHRGRAIRLMNEAIGDESTRATDQTITTVLVFLTGELQQSITSAWRTHVSGLMALFELRGGFGQLARSADHLKPTLLAFLLTIVTANTTSPASDQVAVTSYVHLPDLIANLYGIGIYPPFPCAQHLFLDIGRINHLRARAAANTGDFSSSSDDDIFSLEAEARTLLTHVESFSPEAWAAEANSPDPNLRAAWLLAARIYHAAATLYCISSLQSVSLLPETAELMTRRAETRDRLMVLLAEGLASPLLRRSVLWPLVVAGFEAREGSEVERRFVAGRLEEQSRELGTSQPLVAKGVLERFWGGGGKRWDECFERPYALLV